MVKYSESIKWNKFLLSSYLILLRVFMSSTKSSIFMPKAWDFYYTFLRFISYES